MMTKYELSLKDHCDDGDSLCCVLNISGLDPNDPAHFKRCLDNLEEEMMKKQRFVLNKSNTVIYTCTLYPTITV